MLINNAGYGLLGAVEDVELSEARKQFEVNVFGLAAITKAVVPYMRAQKQGTIINISSIAGRISMPFGHGTPPLNIRLRLLAMPCAWRLPAKEYTLPGDWNQAELKPIGGLIAAEHLKNTPQTVPTKNRLCVLPNA